MIKLLDLLTQAKQNGMLYSSIPYACGIDEAISSVKTNLPDDKGFNKNQLTEIKKDGLTIYEIRKSPKNKRCFSFRVWK